MPTENNPAPRERPMLFNGDMVRAILSDQKTVTRRLVPEWQLPSKTHDDERWISVAQRHPRWGFGVFGETQEECMANYSGGYRTCCPFGAHGDRLWVRETFYAFGRWETRFSEKKGRDEWHFVDMTLECGQQYRYLASMAGNSAPRPRSGGNSPMWWKRPAIHMPRWACRILLEIAAVRVERLQDISEEQAIAEGVSAESVEGYRRGGVDLPAGFAFRDLWQSVYGEESWVSNPWVWVVEFKRVTP